MGADASRPVSPVPDQDLTHQHGRLASLDILRGFAVLGILIMNVQAFALPVVDYISPLGPLSSTPADRLVWALELVLFDGKMRGLFTLLFGASCLLILDRADRSGISPWRTHFSRMAWLLVFGLAHYLFLWWGDILYFYALCGLFLYPLRHMEQHALWALGLMLLAVDFLLTGAVALTSMGEAASDTGDLAGKIQSALSYDPKAYLAEVVRLQGSYGGQVADRAEDFTEHAQTIYDLGLGFFANMVIGMALFRSGFLTGERTTREYIRTALICFGVSLPASVGVMLMMVFPDFESQSVFAAYFVLLMPMQLVMSVGWAAIILAAVKAFGPEGAFLSRVAAAGRAAFTNYLGTTIVMTAIFYGWGLGLFGQVPRHVLPAFVVLGWALILVWSKPWLARFHYGPLEWLWRSLAKGKPMPMRKQPER